MVTIRGAAFAYLNVTRAGKQVSGSLYPQFAPLAEIGRADDGLTLTMDKSDRISGYYKTIALWIERFFALVILGGVVVFTLESVQALAGMDWRAAGTFYELIYRVLLLVIALELVRTLVTHDLRAILELLAFVVARKMLKPDLNVLDILLCVLAFVALLAANYWWLSKPLLSDSRDQDHQRPGQ
jgi:hypothetical protein